MKKNLLFIILLLMISDSGYAATRRIYINFDNRPAIKNSSTGSITPDTSPGIGDLRINYWPGQHTPSVLGTHHKYVAGRSGATGDYALSGIIDPATGAGFWPYIYWYGVDQVVSWSNELYVSFWMKYDSLNFDSAYKSYENIKLFYWFFNPNSGAPELSGEIAVTTMDPGPNPSWIGYYYSWRGKSPYSQNYGHGYPNLADAGGGWHHYEIYIQRLAGRARLFVDGVVRLDWNTGDSANFLYNGTPYIHALHMPSISANIKSTDPYKSHGTRIIDDLEVWDGLPDPLEASSPPPSSPINTPNPPQKLSIQ